MCVSTPGLGAPPFGALLKGETGGNSIRSAVGEQDGGMGRAGWWKALECGVLGSCGVLGFEQKQLVKHVEVCWVLFLQGMEFFCGWCRLVWPIRLMCQMTPGSRRMVPQQHLNRAPYSASQNYGPQQPPTFFPYIPSAVQKAVVGGAGFAFPLTSPRIT